ncbi:MAG TPA: MFS transporter, partial [Saprospiraceae bacterium]|nr:MFS transporter [Saprospiraceae bacterium]
MLNQNGVRGVRFYSMFSNTVNLYRQSFSGLNTSVWFLSLINLINRAGTMVVPFMTMYITQSLHMSLTRAGFVLTCFGTGAIIGALIGGRLTDLFGHYKVQLLTLFFGGLSFILLGQLKDYSAICMMTFILALINEAFRPAN